MYLCWQELKGSPVRANNVDPDQMLQSSASDLGLHCMLLI